MVAWVALLAFAIGLGRTLLDWGFVYPEMGFTDPLAVFATMAFYSALFAVWAWALMALARGARVGAWITLALTLLLNVLLGVGTTVAFCPTPCPTLWPVGEIWNWATTLSGAAAAFLLIRSLRAQGGGGEVHR